MSDEKKKLWYAWEAIAAEYYKNQWYTVLEQNYTIPWGELDLVVQKNDMMVFVEVKVIDTMDDLHDYVTTKKIYFLQRAIEKYLYKHDIIDQEIQLDVVFVKNNMVTEHFRNITNT